jgi:hypothetical protein
VLYNNPLYITNSSGLITFSKRENTSDVMFQDYFDVYVGLVSRKEDVYKKPNSAILRCRRTRWINTST